MLCVSAVIWGLTRFSKYYLTPKMLQKKADFYFYQRSYKTKQNDFKQLIGALKIMILE
jgi:hypothetical protein